MGVLSGHMSIFSIIAQNLWENNPPSRRNDPGRYILPVGRNISLAFFSGMCYSIQAKSLCRCDGMVDVVDSKSTASDGVPVRVRSPAPSENDPSQALSAEGRFGSFVFFGKFEETYFRNGVIKRPGSKPRGPRKKKQIWIPLFMVWGMESWECPADIPGLCR